jgi:ribonuclease/clavin/mitogillin
MAAARMMVMTDGVIWQEVPGRTLPPYAGTACYWLVDGGHAWLVDTGDGQPAALEALRAAWEDLGMPEVEAIVVTHWHTDHTGTAAAAGRLFGAPVFLSVADAETALHHLDDAPPFHDPAELPAGPGALRVEVLEAPGHTAGQLNLWLPEKQVLLAGDNVLGRGTSVVVPPDGHLRTYQATLRRLMALNPARIGPGHGPPLDDGIGVLRYYLDHRQERENQVLARLAQGPCTAQEVAQAVYAGEAPETVALGRLMLMAHLEALVEEGRVAEDHGAYHVIA